MLKQTERLSGSSPAKHQQSLRKAFRRFWREWTSIVRLFARRNEDRFHLKSQDYEDLHRELLFVSRRLRFSREPDARVFGDIADAIEPWVNLTAFEELESERLWKLLDECQQYNRRLRYSGFTLTGLIVLFVTICAGSALLIFAGTFVLAEAPQGLSHVAQIKFKIASGMQTIEQSSTVQRMQILGVVAAVVTILMARCRKSY